MTPRRITPPLHLCGMSCRLKCALGHHERLEPEGKCRCCQRLDCVAGQELSKTARSEGITLHWWEDA